MQREKHLYFWMEATRWVWGTQSQTKDKERTEGIFVKV